MILEVHRIHIGIRMPRQPGQHSETLSQKERERERERERETRRAKENFCVTE
jgi:hypothetical protein